MVTRTVDIPVDFSRFKWATPDDAARQLFPKEGVFRDVLQDLASSTDAPSIYHLASVFTVAATALGQCDIHVGDPAKPYSLPMALWSAVIGESGDRKSSAMERAVYSLKQVDRTRLLPTDASQEGWHLALSEQPVSLLYRDELSGLFDAAQRSYSQGLRSWLLETWAGDDMTRKTLSHQETTIIRPRLSILGGIPPTVFSEKTTKSDWRSGFLARFVYWGGRREKWNQIQRGDSSGKLTTWLNTVACKSQGSIWLPDGVLDPLLDWVYENVERHRFAHKPEVESAFQRLQSVGYKLAAIYEMSLRDKPFGYGGTEQRVQVSWKSVVAILPILTMLRRTTETLFEDTNTSKDASDENDLLRLFSPGVILTRAEIMRQTGHSSKKVNGILSDLTKNEMLVVCIQQSTSVKGGRPRYVYKLPPN